MSTSVRQALSVQPINVANLIHVLSHHLFTLLPSSLFPTSSATFTSGQDPTKEALNCLRVLGRVLVVVYEAEAGGTEVEGEEKSFAQKWLWSRQPVEPRTESNGNGDGEVPTAGEEESQFTIADGEEEEEIEGDGVDGEAQAFKAVVGHPPETNGDRSSPTANGEQIADPLSRPLPPKGDDEEEREEEDMIPCLIDRLFSCTIDLLFCAGFTVPDSVRGQDGPGEKINVRIPPRELYDELMGDQSMSYGRRAWGAPSVWAAQANLTGIRPKCFVRVKLTSHAYRLNRTRFSHHIAIYNNLHPASRPSHHCEPPPRAPHPLPRTPPSPIPPLFVPQYLPRPLESLSRHRRTDPV